MHLTLTITLNIQQSISSQHKVWIFCLQEKAMDIIQEKPCTHLTIYSTEFKIFMIIFVESILKDLKFVYPQLRHSQGMQRLSLLKEH